GFVIVNAARRFLELHEIRGPLLLAISGGPDSTALLLALHEIGIPISAAHINHHLRGAESDADQEFVRELCSRLGIALRVADGSLDPDQIRRHGIEAAARDVRLARLQEIRRETGASHIATANQAREQWTILEEIVDRFDTGKATRDETRFKTFPPELWLRRALLHRHIRRLDSSSRDVSAADLERLASQLDSMKRISVTRNL